MLIEPGGCVPAPAFATPLTLGRPNLLKQARAAAKWLGFKSLAPWQEHFLALATEYEEGNPQDGIVPYWRYLTLTVPRQCGKSECVCTILYLLRWMGFYRSDGDPKMVYTAHSIEACTDQWDTKMGKRMRECAWGKAKQVYFNHAPANLHMRLGKTNRQLVGGRIRILSNSGRSGRGGTEDMVVLDEAREFGDDSTREKTLDPLMNMRPSPQFIITSTMGVEESGYFNRKVDAGRDAVRSQMKGEWPAMRLAYCEWGVGDIKPDGYDPADQDLWKQAHPMLGYGGWSMERMAEKYDMARAENDVGRFQQEYLNQMFAADDAPAVPWEMLEAVETDSIGWNELGAKIVLALFSEPGNYYVAAVAAGAGKLRVVRPVVEGGEKRQIPTFEAEEWLDGFLTEQPRVKQVGFLEGNDLEVPLSKYRRSGVRMVPLKFGDYKEGCRQLKKAMVAEEIQVEHSRYLEMAVAASEVVLSADQTSWYWARKKVAQAPADELRAAVLAWLMWRRIAGRGRAGVVSLQDIDDDKENRWETIYAKP